MSALIEFEEVCKYYQMGDTTVKAADHITMKIDKGEFVAIVGQSGSGKSTCMNIIGCLDVPTHGVYRLNGRDVGKMSRNELAAVRNEMLGFIFQQYNLLPRLNLMENVEVPLVYAGVSRAERHARAREVLEQVGLGDKLKNRPNQLSGGQQQRVSIARALVRNPPVILADEPTGALDSHTGREVLGLLQQLHKQGHTVVLITHDNSIAVQADRIIRLEDGRVVYDGDSHAPEAMVQPTLLPETPEKSFLDKAGKELAPGGVHLSELARISTDALLKEAAECEFVIACDVKNRLCGSNGAAAIFGPQKGATPEQVRILDAALSHYASILNDQLTCNAAETDGSGAAGGLLCGILPYFPVTICSGIDLVLDLTDFDEHVKHADLIITGEGRIDYQSALGKVPVGVASRAKKIRNVPVVAIAGAKGDGCETLYKFGIDAIFDTVPGIMSLEAAMEHAKENLEQTAENVLRLFFAGQENRLR